LGEIADLIERIPDRQLQIAFGGACWEDDLDFDEMLVGTARVRV